MRSLLIFNRLERGGHVLAARSQLSDFGGHIGAFVYFEAAARSSQCRLASFLWFDVELLWSFCLIRGRGVRNECDQNAESQKGDQGYHHMLGKEIHIETSC